MSKVAASQSITTADQKAVGDVMNGIRAIVRALRLNTRAIERQLGISLAQLWVLQILKDRPAESLNELAIATATHQSSVSVVVRRLVDASLVTRATASDDKRRVRIELTDAGRGLLERAPKTVQVELMGGLQRMSSESRTQLSELMREWLTASGLDLSVVPPMLMEDEA
jgi:DNA-binding MarR family transcriptional regulator